MAYRFLLSWRWAGFLMMAALFAAACIGLGNWQMERRNQAVTEIRRVQENYDKPPCRSRTPVHTSPLPTLRRSGRLYR